MTDAECVALILQDLKGARAVPLSGFEVTTPSPSSGERSEVKHVIRLSHSSQTVLLSAQDAELQAKWVDLLSKSARGETAVNASTNVTDHSKSQ